MSPAPKKFKRKPPPPRPRKLPQLISPRHQGSRQLQHIRKLHQNIPRRTPSPKKQRPATTTASTSIQGVNLSDAFFSTPDYERIRDLSPSPNLQTRQVRRTTGVPIYMSSNERDRIARLLIDFADDDTKPCSVFGSQRSELFRAFYFCGNCLLADRQEESNPKVQVNRRAKLGTYTCQAAHTDFGFPTHRLGDDEDEDEDTDPRKKKSYKTNTARTTSDESSNVPPISSRNTVVTVGDNEEKEDVSSSSEDNFSPSDSEEERQMNSLTCRPCTTANVATQTTQPMNPMLFRNLEADNSTTTCEQATIQTAKIQQLQFTNDTLKETVRELRLENRELIRSMKASEIQMRSKDDKIRRLRKEMADLIRKFGNVPTSCTNTKKSKVIVKHIKRVIKRTVCRHAKNSHRSKTFFKLLAEMLLQDNIHDWQLRDTIITVFRKYMRKHVFTPHRILKEMDLSGGTANFESLEILRRVENNGRRYMHTMLPSTSSMQRYADCVERLGQHIIPFHSIRNSTDDCEGFYFRVADIMREILKSGNLLDSVAKIRNILLSQSLDGATLSKNLNHTLCGIKFNDRSNPLRRSRHAVFPVVCVIGGETKLRVRGLFSRVIKEGTEAALQVLVKKYGIKPVILAFNSDMSCEWKISDCGGAAKNTIYPCTKCCWTSEELHTRSQKPDGCNWCVKMGHTLIPGWRCRHSRMCNPKHLAKLKEEMNDFEKSMPAIGKAVQEMWDKSKIKVTVDPRLEPTPAQKKNIRSIHFDVTKCSRQSRSKYNTYITGDMQLREMDVSGPLVERQRRLQIQLGKEWMYKDSLLCQDKHGKGGANTALVMMMSVLPCILHMEIRVGIKMLSLLFKEGLTRAKMDELGWMDASKRGGVGPRCNHLIDTLRQISDTKIQGTRDRPAQTKIPFDKQTNSLGILKYNNVQIRKFLENIHLLVEKCIVKEDEVALWKSSIEHYRTAMTILRRRHRLSSSEMWDFQRKSDFFFRDWLQLHGAEGMTNYVHMMGSGHVLEYLQHWGNLANHSQQGWEAFNSQFKTYFFNRTQRGGSVNKGRGKQSRMLPMARWLQRRLIFMSGYSEKEILERHNNISEEEKEAAKNWVRDNGGTIEFGQLIQSEEESDSVNECGEYVFNWEVGTADLYGEIVDVEADLDLHDEQQLVEQESDLDYDSNVQSTDDEQ